MASDYKLCSKSPTRRRFVRNKRAPKPSPRFIGYACCQSAGISRGLWEMKSGGARVLLGFAFPLPVFSGCPSAQTPGLEYVSSAVGCGARSRRDLAGGSGPRLRVPPHTHRPREQTPGHSAPLVLAAPSFRHTPDPEGTIVALQRSQRRRPQGPRLPPKASREGRPPSGVALRCKSRSAG